MPLARIFTPNPDNARELHRQLVERGYQVEYADPSALIAEPADLEIDVERLPLEDGLQCASEWAADAGSDVYVAPGTMRLMENQARELHPAAAPESPVTPQVAVEPDQILEQQRVIEDQAAVHERQQVMEAAPSEPSAESAPAEISSYVPLTFTQPEQPAEREQGELPEQPAARSDQLREAVVNAAGMVAESLHETKEAVSQGFSDLKHRFVPEQQNPPVPSLFERWNHALTERRTRREERKARQRELARLVREERARREARAEALARDLRELRARDTALRPQVVQGSVAPAMHPHAAIRPAPRPILERRMNPPRRDARDEGAEYWRGAFTGAAVVAAILMIAWATLGTSHPPAPPRSTGQIQQDVPFGPVTLTPGVSTVKPASRAPVVTQPSAQTPTPRTIAPSPKPAPVRAHRARRSVENGGVADDEVIVHHYGAPKPAPTPPSASAKNSGPKRISDQ